MKWRKANSEKAFALILGQCSKTIRERIVSAQNWQNNCRAPFTRRIRHLGIHVSYIFFYEKLIMNNFSFSFFFFKAPFQSTKTGPPAPTAKFALLAASETASNTFQNNTFQYFESYSH